MEAEPLQSVEIKSVTKNDETYSAIALDGVKITDYPMLENEAIVVRDFLKHIIGKGYDIAMIYRPE